MAPGADAVGFVNRQSHQTPLGGMVLQHLPGGFPLQALRSQIKQSQRFIAQTADGLMAPLRIKPGMQAGGSNTPTLQLRDLILHQSDQRRDHHDQPVANQGWQLVTKRLATTGGEHSKGVTSLKNRFHHGTLTRSKGRPTEMILERLFQTIQDAPDLVDSSYRPLDLVSG